MRRLISNLVFWGGFVVGVRAAWRHFGSVLASLAGRLSSAESPPPSSLTAQLAAPIAQQYVVGETGADALTTAKAFHAAGVSASLHQLGEDIQYPHDAIEQRDNLLALIEAIASEELDSSISIKLSQLGITINQELALESLHTLTEAGATHGVTLMLDTEASDTIAQTLAAFAANRASGPLGIGIQAYLYRSADDLAAVLSTSCPVRISYGSYAESAGATFPSPEARDANFLRLVKLALASDNAVKVIIEAHEDHLVQAVLDHVKTENIAKTRFAFEMIYGQREALRAHLVSLGYSVQVYLPFGTAWYPYLMRRMVEKPENLQLFLGGM